MRTIVVALALPLVVLTDATLARSSVQQDQGAARGIYSVEQAKRGRMLYDDQCASCHDGGSMGPALSGEAFFSSWEAQPIGALYTRIVETMPADDPGSLGERSGLDIVAYLLQMNRFPAGTRAIESARELADVTFGRGQ